MKNLNIIFYLLTFTMVLSCSDTFVDVDSDDQNSENFFNTEEDYQLALVAAYDYLQTTARFVLYAEIASDNSLAGGEKPTDTPPAQEIDDMIHSAIGQSGDGGLGQMMSWMYEAVNRCNYIMEFQDKTDFANKTSVLAQTRFLRAYYNFILVNWWGDVPMLIDKRIQFGNQFAIDRTPKEDVFDLIEQDLIFAAANLPYIQNETGRVTKGAAEALLGKVYLYQDNFADAATVFENLINNGPHRLLTTAEYPDLYERYNENNIESVFEIQYSDVDGGSFECFPCLEGNYMAWWSGPRGFVDSNGILEAGYSFNVPVQELVDAFEVGDIRLEYSILDIDQYIADNPGSKYQEEGPAYEQTGYYFRKMMARKGDKDIPDAALTNPDNYRAIRYADVLLMAAEANNRKPSPDVIKAQDYLNQVRNRATLPSVTTTGPNLTNDIYKERRVELCGEGHRFFDLVRTGRAAQEIDGFQVGKHELFPIPIEEIVLTGNRWENNPGY